MGLYGKHILPKAVHFVCGRKPNMRQREKEVPRARGRVLEVGIGSCLNLPFYDVAKMTKVWGLDPAQKMTRVTEPAARSLPFEVEFIGQPGDEIPLEDNSVDTVLVTYTLRTFPDTSAALRQMSRGLRPDGELILRKHGAAPDAGVRRWQDRLSPLWKRLAGGCNLIRPIPALIEAGTFRIRSLDTMYIPVWRPARFNYWGAADAR